MQEKLRLVTQPVIQEVEANMVEEDQRIISEDISRDDSISSTQSQSVQPVEIEQCLEESYPSGTFKPNNHFMNTPPATASKTICSRQRMERGMASLEAILKDIIEAVKVIALITPVDATEAAAVGRRETEFSARFRRLSYQSRRTIATLKNFRLKLKLKGQTDDEGVWRNMLQIISSLRLLLTTYLRYIPLSGGRAFPVVVRESLPIINQALALANEFEVGCSPAEDLLSRLKVLLMQNVEKKEAPVKATKESESMDEVVGSQNASKLFHQLARNTFGPPLGASQQSLKMKSKSSSSPTVKPRGAKILQARTNMARTQRMSADYVAKSDPNSVSTYRSSSRSNNSSAIPPLSILVPQSTNSPSRESRAQYDRETSNGSVEIGSVLTRLQNLELLATQQSRESAISAQEAGGPRLPAHWDKNSKKAETSLDEQKENIQDLGMMLARIQIIKSDFDVVAQKHRSTPVLIQGLHDLPPLTLAHEDPNGIILPERGPTDPQTENVEQDGAMEPLCFQTLENIVNRISEEILAADFTFCAAANG